MRRYFYVGPQALLATIESSPTRKQIREVSDVSKWITSTRQHLDSNHQVIATFIVDINNHLWIADRHSEHVACAGGKPVLSAGEITFHLLNQRLKVSAITNQSTGYCPEPSSWGTVAIALNTVGLIHPDNFTTRFDFRFCHACGSINLIKDDWFVCAVCDVDLDKKWNFNSAP